MISKSDAMVAKGLAIIMIIVSHLMYIIHIPGKIEIILHPLGYLGVSIFLFVSGYGCSVSLENNEYKRWLFIKKRLINILPLLLMVTIVFVILSTSIYNKRYSWIEVLLNAIGLSNSIGKVTWYLSFQYVWYIGLLMTSRNRKRTMAIMVAISIISYFVSVGFRSDYQDFSLWGLNCFSFPAGVFVAINRAVIANYLKQRNNRIKCIIGFCICFLMSFFICYVLLGNSDIIFVQNAIKSVISLFFCIFVMLVISSLRKLPRLIVRGGEYVGTISYELFLLHGYWIFALDAFFNSKSYVIGAVWIVSVFLLSSAVHFLSNKISYHITALN